MVPDEVSETSWIRDQRLVLKALETAESNDEKLDTKCSNISDSVLVLKVQVRIMWAILAGVAVKVIHNWLTGG